MKIKNSNSLSVARLRRVLAKQGIEGLATVVAEAIKPKPKAPPRPKIRKVRMSRVDKKKAEKYLALDGVCLMKLHRDGKSILFCSKKHIRWNYTFSRDPQVGVRARRQRDAVSASHDAIPETAHVG